MPHYKVRISNRLIHQELGHLFTFYVDSARALIGREACLHESVEPLWEYVSMVVTSRYFAFRALITQPRIWKGFWVENSTSVLYLPIPSSAETWKIFTKHFSRGWENSWQLCKTFSVVGGQTHEVNRLILWLVFHNTCSHKAKVWIVWSWPFYQPILINFALSAAATFFSHPWLFGGRR